LVKNQNEILNEVVDCLSNDRATAVTRQAFWQTTDPVKQTYSDIVSDGINALAPAQTVDLPAISSVHIHAFIDICTAADYSVLRLTLTVTRMSFIAQLTVFDNGTKYTDAKKYFWMITMSPCTN
jgi:hypothetical protein